MRKSGVTLVEVMIGVLLSSVVLGGAYQVWTASRRNFAKANARQALQSEIRKTIDQIALDFKAIKAGTLEVAGAADGNSGTIKFQRFLENKDANRIDSKGVADVVYEFRKPRLYRNVGGQGQKLLCSNLKSFDLARGAEPGTLMPDGMQQTAQARIDISLTGAMQVPVTREMIEHNEKTTVVMRNEFIAAAPVKSSIAMAVLTNATEKMTGTEGQSSMFSATLTADALKDMSSQQLAFMMQRETESLSNANREINNTNDQLKDVDAKGAATWYNPFTWGGTDTDVSRIKEDLLKHDKLQDVENDVKALRTIIDRDEERFLRRSLESSGTTLPSDQKEQQAYRQAYDLMVKDRALKEAYEKNPQKDSEGKEIPYKSLLESFDASKIKQGVQYDSQGREVAFTESDADFQKRSAEARKIQEASTKIDLTWMNTGDAKEEVKQYSAAKDLVDIAVVKQSYIQSRDLAQGNIDLIGSEQRSRN
ncbi:MAG TPA: prepilin-type N-terminal cleavage/methylation domain-containing protein [Candidatus Ozemobacteraceae bacterium]|nr:prepilin-type N-terminal cleavage/methylation domain-containing protein [Candidatus Ozemobacteraceae bacterium]